MRFSAPEHVTEALLSTGPFPVVEGVLEVPDDTPTADLGGLRVNGFVLLKEDIPEAPKSKSAKASAADPAETEPKGAEHPEVDPAAGT